MTIGQVTISAADWLASRVSDRMALVVAGQKTDLAQQTGAKSVQPVEENAGAQLERRERERSLLAAQESYKRVAQRIKSRLANPASAETANVARSASDRAIVLEGLRDNPKFMTTVLASENKVEPAAPNNAAATRTDPIFGLVETESKKAADRRAESVEEKEKDAAEIQARTAIDRKHQAQETDPVFDKGLWDDLFDAREMAELARDTA